MLARPLPQPPDNLPIDPADDRWMSPAVDQASLFTSDDVVRLREALVADLGHGDWTDDEIRAMARETLDLITALLDIAQARVRRGAPITNIPDAKGSPAPEYS